MAKSNASITDISRKCGVSPMTVSRALRGDPAVAEETRTKIVATAEALGYHPRAKMGRPRRATKQPTRAIDIVLNISLAPTSMFSQELVVSIERELSAHSHG